MQESASFQKLGQIFIYKCTVKFWVCIYILHLNIKNTALYLFFNTYFCPALTSLVAQDLINSIYSFWCIEYVQINYRSILKWFTFIIMSTISLIVLFLFVQTKWNSSRYRVSWAFGFTEYTCSLNNFTYFVSVIGFEKDDDRDKCYTCIVTLIILAVILGVLSIVSIVAVITFCILKCLKGTHVLCLVLNILFTLYLSYSC